MRVKQNWNSESYVSGSIDSKTGGIHNVSYTPTSKSCKSSNKKKWRKQSTLKNVFTLKFHENSSNHPRKSLLCFSNKNGSSNSSCPLHCIRSHLNAQRCIRPPKNLIFQEVTRCHEYRVNHCQLTRHLHYMEA